MQIQIEVPNGHPLARAYTEAVMSARHADFYNLLNREILRELDATEMARERTEELIAKLIEGLDEVDGDPDLEPSLSFMVAGHLDECEIEDEGDELEGSHGEGDEDVDRELTSCETRGAGFTKNGGIGGDDDEDSHDREDDPAEWGLADKDALELWHMVDAPSRLDFDGSGIRLGRQLLQSAAW